MVNNFCAIPGAKFVLTVAGLVESGTTSRLEKNQELPAIACA
jgi:hypothetical protein